MAKEKKKSGIFKKLLILILLALIGVAVFIGYKTHANGGGMQGLLSTIVGNDSETLEELDQIQILLLGVSTDLGGKITDTIMVATYNPQKQTASLLSIPRDTYTGNDVSNGSTSEKINALYTSGIDVVLKEVNELTGLDLEYYMVIDNQALIKLVDIIGGVEFEVPMDMYYTDPTQNLVIDLKEGLQVLNGEQAEQLLRFRKNNDGTGYPASYGLDDIGRMKTQRNFIIATAKQTLQLKNILKIKEIIDVLYEYVDTNLSLSAIKSYVPYIIDFDINNIQSAVLPGTSVGPTQTGSLYAPYWFIVINKKEAAELLEELYSEDEETESTEEIETSSSGTTEATSTTSTTEATSTDSETVTKTEASKIKIEILNGSGTSSNLTKVQKLLKNIGYNVTTKTTTTTSRTTIINKTDVDSKYIEQIQELLGVGIVSSNSASSSNVDITIIIGKDYEG